LNAVNRYYKAMKMEHCDETGSDMKFTTRNYGICTFAKQEWDIVVNGTVPPAEHMHHRRAVPSVTVCY
jgi:hypothetical protein